MKISPKLRAVIITAIDDAGGITEFANKVGLSAGTISRYRGGQIKSFSDEAWKKVRPLIMPYADLSVELAYGDNMPGGELALTVDQQLLLKKYCRLRNDQKVHLAEYVDELLRDEAGAEKSGTGDSREYLAAEAPSAYTESDK